MKTALTGILFFVLMHPVHVSVTGIEFDQERNIFTLFVKVYSDDMERDMKIGNRLTGESFISNEEGYQKWLSDRVGIMVDGEPLLLKLKMVEIDGLEHKFTLEAKSKRKAAVVSVLNTINTRLYQDQSNMLMFKYNDVEEGYKLTASDTIKVFVVQ